MYYVEHPVTAANILNYNLSRIYFWAGDLLVDFNAAETEAMIFTRERNKPLHPPLLVDNMVLYTV